MTTQNFNNSTTRFLTKSQVVTSIENINEIQKTPKKLK